MERNKYDTLYSDDNVVKYNDWSGRHFKSENGKLIVGIFFTHREYPENYSGFPQRRIVLTVFSFENLNIDIPLYQAKNNFLILTNKDFPDLAFTYRVKIDEDAKSATIIVEDYPELEKSLMTEDEENGLTVDYDN
ncbi:hypothetical protein [Salibacter halophilus]|uniref:Uncharacterized protein n=1 Tax=Salibacter halophilus TaxID=1803916 RepID=A0A6N6M7B6_9FLAO|nr:hypothetical protein [Salibacter halophilus]KAB1065950.1 hypothetical protein F3059_00320 [Salibacter halophilus]